MTAGKLRGKVSVSELWIEILVVCLFNDFESVFDVRR